MSITRTEVKLKEPKKSFVNIFSSPRQRDVPWPMNWKEEAHHRSTSHTSNLKCQHLKWIQICRHLRMTLANMFSLMLQIWLLSLKSETKASEISSWRNCRFKLQVWWDLTLSGVSKKNNLSLRHIWLKVIQKFKLISLLEKTPSASSLTPNSSRINLLTRKLEARTWTRSCHSFKVDLMKTVTSCT